MSKRLFKRILIVIPAIALGAALAGCNRSNDGDTVGQRIDETVARTEQATQQATQQARQAVTEAGQRAAEAVNDTTITAEIKSALAADPELSAVRIDVETQGGVVTLRGPAPSETARTRATTLAAAPKGVVRVENQLQLKQS